MRVEKWWTWFDCYAAPKLDQWKGMYRANTFRKMFEHLESLDRAVNILETGCIEGVELSNWGGNGCSTVLFDKFIETHPGSQAVSVELIVDKIKAAQKHCPRVKFLQGDSVEVLKTLVHGLHKPIDLLFLDASHHYWTFETPSQAHHFAELMAIMPQLHDRTLVVVDDSISIIDDYPMTRIAGKGGIVAQYALEVGAVMEFCEYQVGFTKITNTQPRVEHQVEELILLARKYVEEGRVEAADRLYRLVLAITPPPYSGKIRIARGEAYANYGRTAHKIRNYGKAIDWFRYALEVDPLAVEYRCELVRSLVAVGAMTAAKRECIIATQIEPENPNVWAAYGGVESDMRNEEGTIVAYDAQIEAARKMDPIDHHLLSDALLNRATIAIDTKDYEYARKIADEIFSLGVRHGDAWHALAIIEYRLSNHEKSIEMFDNALSAGCRNKPLTHWNRSLPLQSIGRFKEAFEDHAWGEHELTVTAIYVPHRRFKKPHWKGQRNSIVHVHTEAGHGDNILMLRYLPLFKERFNCTVRYECDPHLLSLAQRSFPDIEMFPRAKDYPGALGIKDFDYHLPIGELPHRFGTDIDNVPWSGPYLKADPELSAEMSKKLLSTSGRRIGLVWSSGIRTDMNIWMEKYGRMKSMHFADMTPILNNRDLFVSLQVMDGREEFIKAENCIEILPLKPTWDDTAAVIDNLDLIITVDTGVAHLAAAMGKETWVIMQRDGASYHFLCYCEGAKWNEKSPWYPSVKVFRQHNFKAEDWRGVVQDITKALKE